jgi:hypothetical protein
MLITHCYDAPIDYKFTPIFYDTWETLVKDNYKALQQQPGIGYFNSRRGQRPTDLDWSGKRPSGLEWTSIGKLEPKEASIHGSRALLQMFETTIRE